jgi:hypothetical protein
MFLDHLLQAAQGCDLDVVRALPGEPEKIAPRGLLSGRVGGW